MVMMADGHTSVTSTTRLLLMQLMLDAAAAVVVAAADAVDIGVELVAGLLCACRVVATTGDLAHLRACISDVCNTCIAAPCRPNILLPAYSHRQAYWSTTSNVLHVMQNIRTQLISIHFSPTLVTMRRRRPYPGNA